MVIQDTIAIYTSVETYGSQVTQGVSNKVFLLVGQVEPLPQIKVILLNPECIFQWTYILSKCQTYGIKTTGEGKTNGNLVAPSTQVSSKN